MIGLRDANKAFPVATDVGVLKWRFQTQDETEIPLTSSIYTHCYYYIFLLALYAFFKFFQVNCWPSESKSGCDVSIEYELQKLHLELQNILVIIPLP